MKVNVQLIRATTDEHLWAESYNRKLDDVFGVEGEVAATIADQLNAKLSGAEQKAVSDKPTENPAAYDAYLRGLAIEHNRASYRCLPESEGLLQEGGRSLTPILHSPGRASPSSAVSYISMASIRAVTPAASVKEAAIAHDTSP